MPATTTTTRKRRIKLYNSPVIIYLELIIFKMNSMYIKQFNFLYLSVSYVFQKSINLLILFRTELQYIQWCNNTVGQFMLLKSDCVLCKLPRAASTLLELLLSGGLLGRGLRLSLLTNVSAPPS